MARAIRGRRWDYGDANGNKTSYAYDGFDRLVKTSYPNPSTTGASSTTDYELTGYDAYGRVNALINRAGTSLSIAYDALNRPTTLPTGATVGYDLAGNATTLSLGGQTLTDAYDALGRVTSSAQPAGTVSYQYDAAGERTRMTWPDSFYVAYDYDAAGELLAVRENGATSGVGVLTSLQYDDAGARSRMDYGNGETIVYGHDGLSRLTSLAIDMGGPGVTTGDQTLGLSYNPASQIAARTSANSAYDFSPVNASTSYSVNGLNQATPSGFTYDAKGNLTSDGTHSFGYDSLNKLTSGPGSAALSYDPADRLYQTSASGAATTRFLYDGDQMIAEYDTSGNVLRRYVDGPAGDEPLVWYEGSSTSDRRFLASDERGSVILSTDIYDGLLSINTYDEYGQPGSSNSGRFGYTGQAYVPEVGLYDYKARVYSPSLGRFMQTDPLGFGGGDMNLYAYTGDDPINGIDPSGMKKKCNVGSTGGTYSGAPGMCVQAPPRPSVNQGPLPIGATNIRIFGPGGDSGPQTQLPALWLIPRPVAQTTTCKDTVTVGYFGVHLALSVDGGPFRGFAPASPKQNFPHFGSSAAFGKVSGVERNQSKGPIFADTMTISAGQASRINSYLDSHLSQTYSVIPMGGSINCVTQCKNAMSAAGLNSIKTFVPELAFIGFVLANNTPGVDKTSQECKQ